jgi:hypothetical protein
MPIKSPRRMPGKQIHRGPRPPTKEQMLLAQVMQNPDSETVHNMLSELSPDDQQYAEEVNVSHKRGSRIILYKPIVTKGRQVLGYARKEVSAHVLGVLIEQGWIAACPNCGSDCGGGPNDCPGQEKRKFRRCLECGKRFYDPGASDVRDDRYYGADDEEFEIDMEVEQGDSPEARTLDMLLTHYEGYHPTEMRRRGLTRPKPAVDASLRGVVGAGRGGWTSQQEPVEA